VAQDAVGPLPVRQGHGRERAVFLGWDFLHVV
jgi:hypothetical protein